MYRFWYSAPAGPEANRPERDHRVEEEPEPDQDHRKWARLRRAGAERLNDHEARRDGHRSSEQPVHREVRVQGRSRNEVAHEQHDISDQQIRMPHPVARPATRAAGALGIRRVEAVQVNARGDRRRGEPGGTFDVRSAYPRAVPQNANETCRPHGESLHDRIRRRDRGHDADREEDRPVAMRAQQDIDHDDEEERRQVPRHLETPKGILHVRQAQPHDSDREDRQERETPTEVSPQEQEQQAVAPDHQHGAEQENMPDVVVIDPREQHEDEPGNKEAGVAVLTPEILHAEVPTERQIDGRNHVPVVGVRHVHRVVKDVKQVQPDRNADGRPQPQSSH